MLHIRQAEESEYPEVRHFYHSLIRAMEGSRYLPGWEIDVYPAPDYLKDCLRKQELYVGELDGEMASCMVVNQDYNEAYDKIDWPTPASGGEFLVVHALGVHPDFAGRGLAKEMVQEAVRMARGAGMKAVRLDVLRGNLPAEKLYESQGFRRVQVIPMFYEDTGWTDYEGYELPL